MTVVEEEALPKSEIHLFIPGPAGADAEVLDALARPITPHYGADFVREYNECRERMKRVFRTTHDLYLMVGPGTAALDGAMASALPDGSRVLVPANGWFGARMGRMFKAHRAEVEIMEFPLDGAIDADRVVERIREEPRLTAVGWVHHETSTGVLNPVREIATAAREHGVLSIIDAVSSVGGTELAVDDWCVDLCVSVSNKSLASQPGIAAISVSPLAWEAIDANPDTRSWYLDLRTWRAYDTTWAAWHPYPTTVPPGLVYALNVALGKLLDEGLERRLERTRAVCDRVRSELRALGFEMFVPDEVASPVTTSVVARDDLPADDLVANLQRRHGIYISGGLDDLHGKIFRIGHMGSAIREEEVDLLLAAIRQEVDRVSRAVETSAEVG